MAALAVLVLAVLAATLYLPWRWGQIDQLALTPVLSPAQGEGTNYLLVGTDSRAGISAEDPNAGVLIGEEVAGQRSDTALILRVGDGPARFMSLPRDLWVPLAPGGDQQRINTAYARNGPSGLIETVTQSLGIPVHHYLEIDLASFAELVDALGGVTLEIPHPARDTASGLDIAESGLVHLDGTQALAYVRSRQYTELIEGQWVLDARADLGRVLRQQAFMRAVLAEITSTRNPVTLNSVLGAVTGGVVVDDRMGVWDAIGLARSLRGAELATVELPVSDHTTSGGADVLLLGPGADEVMAGFR